MMISWYCHDDIMILNKIVIDCGRDKQLTWALNWWLLKDVFVAFCNFQLRCRNRDVGESQSETVSHRKRARGGVMGNLSTNNFVQQILPTSSPWLPTAWPASPWLRCLPPPQCSSLSRRSSSSHTLWLGLLRQNPFQQCSLQRWARCSWWYWGNGDGHDDFKDQN